jgi:hypothetical protein
LLCRHAPIQELGYVRGCLGRALRNGACTGKDTHFSRLRRSPMRLALEFAQRLFRNP